MQISGRVLILTVFGIALALSGGAWWHHYQSTRHSAEFWGVDGARLLVKAPQVELLHLGPPASDGPQVAGLAVTATHDLSDKPGLIHLRSFALTQDAHFDWPGRTSTSATEDRAWRYALRFADGERALVVLLREDFTALGKLDGERIDILPSARIAPSTRRYLTDVGALPSQSPPPPATPAER